MALSVLVAGLLVATVVAAPSMLFSAESEADLTAIDMVIVTGKVWENSMLVSGAEVNVSMYDGAVLRSYCNDVTDSQGVYSTTFSNGFGLPWAVGDTILVVAKHDPYENSNSTTATDQPIQYVNVTLGEEIPEFGSLGTVVPVIGVLGMFVALFLVRKERRD